MPPASLGCSVASLLSGRIFQTPDSASQSPRSNERCLLHSPEGRERFLPEVVAVLRVEGDMQEHLVEGEPGVLAVSAAEQLGKHASPEASDPLDRRLREDHLPAQEHERLDDENGLRLRVVAHLAGDHVLHVRGGPDQTVDQPALGLCQLVAAACLGLAHGSQQVEWGVKRGLVQDGDPQGCAEGAQVLVVLGALHADLEQRLSFFSAERTFAGEVQTDRSSTSSELSCTGSEFQHLFWTSLQSTECPCLTASMMSSSLE
eukprot:38322-Hanusia_phi.AAC.1